MDPADHVRVTQVPDLGRVAELEAGREQHRAHRSVGQDRPAGGEQGFPPVASPRHRPVAARPTRGTRPGRTAPARGHRSVGRAWVAASPDYTPCSQAGTTWSSSQRRGSTRGRMSCGLAVPDRDLGRDRVRQEQRHRLGEAVGADIENRQQVADLGRAHDHSRWPKTSSPEHSGPATVTGRSGPWPASPARSPSARIRCSWPTSAGRRTWWTPPSRMTTIEPSTVLRSTTRARYAPARPTRNRPGSSSSRASRRTGSDGPCAGDRSEARRRPGRGRATPGAARTGSRGRRRRRPVEAASRPSAPSAGRSRRSPSTCSTSRRRRARSRRRRRAGPSSSRCGDAAARRAAAHQVGGIHPELACAVVADEPDPLQPGASDTAARSMTGWRRPAAAAIASSLASSPGDSTVTARIPAATAARSSSSRLPGPVITTRPAGIPARATSSSSPPEATSAPSP